MLLWILALTFMFYTFTQNQQRANAVELEYGVFRQMVADGKISRVVMTSDRYMIYPKVDAEGKAAAPETGAEVELFDLEVELEEARAQLAQIQANRPSLKEGDSEALARYQQEVTQAEQRIQTIQTLQGSVRAYYCTPVTDAGLIPLMDEVGLEHYGVETQSRILAILTALLPSVLMVGLFYLLMRSMFSKMGGGMGGLGGVGKANAKVYVEKTTGVTFRDVAGQDEAKESLQEIIDILHNPQKYTEIGAKLPKGALLVGPPGTGKTLLAKAVAGEANVPFFSISGSDFVEMYVGVGASRVRDLFKEAAKMAPCIIFIDEIDTIGKSRNERYGGGNDEREQTLNQLLAELDGFDPTKGVIVLGATNRPEVLDSALLRPGRFDRRITIDRPNLAGRLATLQVHTRKIKLSDDVDLKKIALATAGCVGADLANMVNEAALRAVRKGRSLVTQEDLLSAFEFVIVGSEKKGSVLTEFEKKLVAYHEVGHAMVAYKQKNGKPVQKITIVPHTQGALGYTLHLPEEDKVLSTKKELLAQITTSMGGRAAEQVVFDEETNGAAQDIQDATNLARNMVALYGMSEKFGMMALASRRSQYLDGGYGIDCAQDTAADIDEAVRVIISNAYDEAVKILTENREDMDKVAAYLIAKETITGAEMVAILEGRDPETAEAEAYGSSVSQERKPLYGDVEPPAKAVHMVSEPVEAPKQSEEPPAEEPAPEPDTAASGDQPDPAAPEDGEGEA
ncbi:MAG: ATP-dependent zinc metalloprotease FtsH [Oscillospiraceae bacterium]|nr:ATP-dependent zinc metalloprotease FtsH [Oscillospiraceae bacterium]